MEIDNFRLTAYIDEDVDVVVLVEHNEIIVKDWDFNDSEISYYLAFDVANNKKRTYHLIAIKTRDAKALYQGFKNEEK